MTTPIISPAMRRKAEALALLVPTFHRGRSKETGEAFVLVPGSAPMTAHRSTSYGCTCTGFSKRGTCTHQLAVQIAERAARQVPGAEHVPIASPTSWRPCSRGCGELLAPEHRYRMCDGCFEKAQRLLDAAAA